MLLEPMADSGRAPMSILRDLPDFLQSTLGLCGEANYLVGALTLAGLSNEQILQRTRGSYVLPVERHGVDLMLRHVPDDADVLATYSTKPPELWAIEGFAIHLAPWKGGLPGALTLGARGEDVLQAFAVPADEAMQLPQMLCFEKAENERRIGVVALTGSDGGRIESLIVKHQGAFILASALPPWPSESPPATRTISRSVL
jgi:hypothetical protein